MVCGQGGIFELTTSNAFSNIYPVKTFNFGVGALGDLYIGISAAYGGFGWPQGFYAPAVSTTVLDNVDINALVVTEGCE